MDIDTLLFIIQPVTYSLLRVRCIPYVHTRFIRYIYLLLFTPHTFILSPTRSIYYSVISITPLDSTCLTFTLRYPFDHLLFGIDNCCCYIVTVVTLLLLPVFSYCSVIPLPVLSLFYVALFYLPDPYRYDC